MNVGPFVLWHYGGWRGAEVRGGVKHVGCEPEQGDMEVVVLGLFCWRVAVVLPRLSWRGPAV